MNFADGFVLALTIIFLAYFAYATPIIMVGVWRYKKHGFASEEPGEDWDPPNVSILVPVKNEEKVVGRLLDAITKLDYPKENLEVVVVEDGSRDRTLEICNHFSRQTALERVGLWDANSIVEDAELAVRFARAGIPTKLAPVECWQEMPAKVKSLLKQRIRWSGGNIQTGLKHWDAWRSMSPSKAFDMEVLMMSPIMAILAFVGWALLALGVGNVGIPVAELVPLFVVMGALNIFYFGTLLTVVVAQAKTGIVSYLTLVLATYPYATLLSVANFVGLISVLVLGRRLWLKTEKTGYVDSPHR